jgi:antitoxin (DNA-binding transcriptional repressor) of toxin-antitoxin stability system
VSENAIAVADAAKDFLKVLGQVESSREPATLVRNGHPVAKLIPLPQPAGTCEELARRWEKMSRLPLEEAEALASDIENARATLPPLKPAWD